MEDFKKPDHGQSLVEMAVITPLLVFMFIGLVEVGWAILGYMTLLNHSRELARFSTRQEIAANWNVDSELAFDTVLTYYDVVNTRQFAPTTIIIHHYEIFVGIICQEGGCYPDCASPETSDDRQEFWLYKRDLAGKISRVDDNDILQQLASASFTVNCERQVVSIENCLDDLPLEQCKSLANDLTWRAEFPETSIMVEIFYDQPQLTGFYWFANPIPLRAYTIMKAPRLLR